MGLSCASPVTPNEPTLLLHCSNLRSGNLSQNLSCKENKTEKIKTHVTTKLAFERMRLHRVRAFYLAAGRCSLVKNTS